MPMMVLAAKLCPPGVEATLFSLLMGLSNFGSTTGYYVGQGMLSALDPPDLPAGHQGGVSGPAFRNLEWLVLIQALTRALPLLLVPFLIPTGSPTNEEAFGFDIFRASQAQAKADRMADHWSADDDDHDDGKGDGKNAAASSGEETEHVINFCAMEMPPVGSEDSHQIKLQAQCDQEERTGAPLAKTSSMLGE